MRTPDTITEAGARLRAGETSCVELVLTFLDRIDTLQPALNAFVNVTRERAFAEAAVRDAELRAGHDRGPLHGIPIVHKDCFDVLGAPTSAGSALYRSRIPASDAVVVQRLAEAGAVTLGKTNMNELAAGVCGRNVHFGDVHNPWDPALSPGGSSSGTAAAIAAGLCLGGTGTDAGGSIRVPAACNGLVGLRTTFGRVPVAGCVPRSRTYDVVGPLARTVRDCALLFEAMAGRDSNRAPSAETAGDDCVAAADAGSLKGVRLGIVEDFSLRDVDAGVQDCLRAALDAAAGAGAQVETVRVDALSSGPPLDELMDIMLYEFHELMAADLAAHANRGQLLGQVVRANLERGGKISAERYRLLVGAREAAAQSVRESLSGLDALVTPVLLTPIPRLDASAEAFDRGRELMLPVSFTGVPAISLPCGRSPSGLPVGMQLIGSPHAEAKLLAVAAGFERLILGWKWVAPLAAGGAPLAT